MALVSALWLVAVGGVWALMVVCRMNTHLFSGESIILAYSLARELIHIGRPHESVPHTEPAIVTWVCSEATGQLYSEHALEQLRRVLP